MSLKLNFIFASPGMSGGVKSTRLIAEAMARRGHEVRLCYPRFRERPARGRLGKLMGRSKLVEPAEHHLKQTSVETVVVDGTEVGPEDVPPADFCVSSWWAVRERVQGWPRELGEPVHYIRHHEVYAGDGDRARAVYRLPGRKVAIARWLVRTLEDEYGQSGVAYIPNGIDHNQFSSGDREPSGRRVLGFLYSRKSWKNCAMLYDAIARLRAQGVPFEVVAFGSDFPVAGEAFPADAALHVLPRQERIAEIYRSIDCWAVSSDFEGLGMTGLEAAACGCPLVSTRSGGPEDYTIEGENGRLVPPKDPAAMANAIAAVLGSSDEAWRSMSVASRRIASGFDWDRSAAKFEAFLVSGSVSAGEGVAS